MCYRLGGCSMNRNCLLCSRNLAKTRYASISGEGWKYLPCPLCPTTGTIVYIKLYEDSKINKKIKLLLGEDNDFY